MAKTKQRHIIGPIEYVTLVGNHGEARVKAKIDTGATRTSVDLWLAARIGLGPTVDVARVKSAMTDEPKRRPVVRGIIRVGGYEFKLPVSIEDRSDMTYPILVGMDVLKSGRFLIDPTKRTKQRFSVQLKQTMQSE